MTVQRRFGLVLSLAMLLAASGGVWAREARPASTVPAEVWRAEAESGALTDPMALGTDTGASACRYVSASGQTGAVTYILDVPATGQYYLWARVKGTSWTANSFWVSWDGGMAIHYEVPQFGGQWAWGWDAVRLVDQAPSPTALNFGAHTLHVAAREPGARLDALVLTADASYTPTAITPCGQTPTPTATPYVAPTPTPVGGGTSGWVIETVDAPIRFGQPGDHYLALDSEGWPHIVYGEWHLCHSWQDDDGWHTEIADSADEVGSYASLAIDPQDRLHVSYYDTTNGDLKYAVCDGNGWQTEKVDSDGDVGICTSIAVDGANQASISYREKESGTVKLATQASDGWHVETVQEASVGGNTSLVFDQSGEPGVAFCESGSSPDYISRLWYAYRDGTQWHFEVIAEDTGGSENEVGSEPDAYCSLAIDHHNNVHIAYYDCSFYGGTGYACSIAYAFRDVEGWHTELSSSLNSLDIQGMQVKCEPNGMTHAYCGRVGLVLDAEGYPHITFHISYEGNSLYASPASYVYRDAAGWHGMAIGGDPYTDANPWLFDSDPYAALVLDQGQPLVAFAGRTLMCGRLEGDTWLFADVELTGQAGGGVRLRIDQSDAPHMSYSFWPGGGLSSSDVRYARREPSAWCSESVLALEPSPIGGQGRWSEDADLAVGSANEINVAYGYVMGMYMDLDLAVVSSRTPTGWDLEYIDLGSEPVCLAIDGTGTRHVAYASESCLSHAAQDTAGGPWAWPQQSLCSDDDWVTLRGFSLDSVGQPHLLYSFAYSSAGEAYLATGQPTGWYTETLAVVGNGGPTTCMAMDNDGEVGLAFYDAASSSLRYAWQTGTEWHSEIVDSGVFSLTRTSLALDSHDQPHIAYEDREHGWLKYASRDASGWHARVVDANGRVGRSCSLALDSHDEPHIAYQDTTRGHLKYAHWVSGTTMLWLPMLTR